MNIPEHKPTAEEVGAWDVDELLEWIQQVRPKLLRVESLEKFKAAEISGEVFLNHAGDYEVFRKIFNLSVGPSVVLAELARVIKEGETAGMKSKLLSFIPCTPRRQ